MKTFILLCAALCIAGCAMKTKNKTLFCVGACMQTETQTESVKKGEPPEKPAPDAEDEEITPAAASAPAR